MCARAPPRHETIRDNRELRPTPSLGVSPLPFRELCLVGMQAARLLHAARLNIMREARRHAWFGQGGAGELTPAEMARQLHGPQTRPPTPLSNRAKQYYWRPASFPVFEAKAPRGSKQRTLTNNAGAQGLYKPSPWI